MNDTLAAYMTSILDMGYTQQYKTFSNATGGVGASYQLAQKQSEQDLNRVMAENDLTLLELFEKLAVRFVLIFLGKNVVHCCKLFGLFSL